MLTLLATIFPTLAGWLNLIIGYFQTSAQNQANQNTSVQSGIAAHNNDGAQSVADQLSTDAQIAALKKLDQQIDNPTPVEVAAPTVPTKGST